MVNNLSVHWHNTAKISNSIQSRTVLTTSLFGARVNLQRARDVNHTTESLLWKGL
jgi:hypothetical protein